MCEPVLMSKKSFDKLNKQQQNAVIAAGKGARAYFESKADDVNDDVNKEAIKTFKDHRIPIITAARSGSTSTLPLRRTFRSSPSCWERSPTSCV